MTAVAIRPWIPAIELGFVDSGSGPKGSAGAAFSAMEAIIGDRLAGGGRVASLDARDGVPPEIGD